jgi:hypothetical protein
MIGQVQSKWDEPQSMVATCLLFNGQKDPSAVRPVMAASRRLRNLTYNLCH